MVFVSRETSEQTRQRLQSVLRVAELKIFEEPYTYVEEQDPYKPIKLDPAALAFVRDENSVSQLVPAKRVEHVGNFMVVCFHFPSNLDNSGFVGWLAARFKEALGTGVFVICGHNSARGGVYDYFGIPEELRSSVNNLLAEWRTGSGE